MNELYRASYNGFTITGIMENPNGDFTLDFYNSSTLVSCTIMLERLDYKFYTAEGILLHSQHELFSSADYFQYSIDANPKGKGLCSMFHDYIMENYKKFGFPINNIYSSLIDNILDDGINFWNSRVRKGKAEFVYGFQRYRMILPK